MPLQVGLFYIIDIRNSVGDVIGVQSFKLASSQQTVMPNPEVAVKDQLFCTETELQK